MEQSTQPPDRLLPIDIDRMKQELRIATLMHRYEPVEAFYMHPIDFHKLLPSHSSQRYTTALTYNWISVFSDPIVTPCTFFICEPGLFEIYKKLKSSPYIDKNWNDSKLQNVAAALWESEKKSRDSPQFEWTFTDGEKFPTGAKYIPKIPIDFIDINGQKF